MLTYTYVACLFPHRTLYIENIRSEMAQKCLVSIDTMNHFPKFIHLGDVHVIIVTIEIIRDMRTHHTE